MFAMEATPANREVEVPSVDGHTEDEVLEHLEMLDGAGLIEAKFVRAGSGEERLLYAHIVRITHSGHDFIAKARSDTVWQRTKGHFAENGMTMSMDLVTAVLAKVATQLMDIS